MARAKSALFLLIILLSLLLSGCSKGADRSAIERLLKERQQALTSRDSRLYLTLISRDYQDKGLNYQTKSVELQNTLAAFDSIEYRVTAQRIELRGNAATVTGDYDLKVISGGKSLKMSGKEELGLRREREGWRIVSGL